MTRKDSDESNDEQTYREMYSLKYIQDQTSALCGTAALDAWAASVRRCCCLIQQRQDYIFGNHAACCFMFALNDSLDRGTAERSAQVWLWA